MNYKESIEYLKNVKALNKNELQKLPYEIQYILYRNNIKLFARDFFNLKLYPHQIKILNFIENHKYSLIQVPRGHGKTEAICRVYTLHKILFNNSTSFLFLSESGGNVGQQSYLQVRNELENNKNILNFFGRYYNEGTEKWELIPDFTFKSKSNWTKDQFTLSTISIDESRRDPTCRSAGRKTALTGSHPEYILADDIESSDSVRTEYRRADSRDWFSKTILPLLEDNPESKFVVIGTTKHINDLYKTLENSKMFAVLKMGVVVEGDIYDDSWYEVKYIKSEDGNYETKINITDYEHYKTIKPLWIYDEDTGKGWTVEKILERKHQLELISEGSFASEYMNETLTDKYAIFPMSILNNAKDKDLSYIESYNESKYKYIIHSWDFGFLSDKSQATEKDSDYTVGYILGITEDYTVDLLYFYRNRGVDSVEIENTIEELYLKFQTVDNRYTGIIVDSVAGQTMFIV